MHHNLHCTSIFISKLLKTQGAEIRKENGQNVSFLQTDDGISAISPSLWLPVAWREYTGYCTELHSHMAESEEGTPTPTNTNSVLEIFQKFN